MDPERMHPSLRHEEFTLDDTVFPPRRIPDFEVSEVDLAAPLTKRTTLKVPLISSPMDTVTGHEMAILVALQGGIGVIHYNYPTLEDQMEEIRRVRRHEAGFVLEPDVLAANATVGTVFTRAEQTGFFSYPITEDGTLDTRLVGIITHRDVRFCEDPSQSIAAIMTPRDRVVTAPREETLDRNDIRAANAYIRQYNVDTLPIVDQEGRVVALVTDSDIAKDQRYPLATKDHNKQLKVYAAVESRLEGARERIAMVAAAGASGIVVDARNIFRSHIDIARYTRKYYPDIDIILGNVVTGEVVRAVMEEAGDCVDAFRIGIGTGEVCTTTEALGIGRALGVSVHDIEQTLQPYKNRYGHIGLIADGGIKSPQHIVAALMLGADAVMMGSELAGLEQSPVNRQYNDAERRMVKKVRGMGSPEAIRDRAGANRYMVQGTAAPERFAEGIEKVVPYKGDGEQFIRHLFAGVRQTLHGLGHRNVAELHNDGYIAPRITSASKGMT